MRAWNRKRKPKHYIKPKWIANGIIYREGEYRKKPMLQIFEYTLCGIDMNKPRQHFGITGLKFTMKTGYESINSKPRLCKFVPFNG